MKKIRSILFGRPASDLPSLPDLPPSRPSAAPSLEPPQPVLSPDVLPEPPPEPAPAPQEPRRVVVYGIAHPVTRAAFDYVQSLLSAPQPARDGVECGLVTTGEHRPDPAEAIRIYLRTEVVEALALVALAEVDKRSTLGPVCAHVDRLDRLWAQHSKLSIENALRDELYVVRFLSEHIGVPLDPPMLDRVRTGFATFVERARGFSHPLRYVRAVEVDEAGFGNSYAIGAVHPTTTHGSGSASLAGGWGWPESWGVWSRRDKSSLRMRLTRDASMMVCDCSPFPVEVTPQIYVNGLFVEPEVRCLGHTTELRVPLPALGPESGLQLSVDFLVDHATNTFGLGLRSFILLDEPRGPAPLRVDDPGRAFLRSGFSLTPCPASSEPVEPCDVDRAGGEMVARRSPKRILIVTPDAGAAWRRLGPLLPKAAEVAYASIGEPSPADPPAVLVDEHGPKALHADFSETVALPDSSALLLDLVHFHDVQGHRRLREVLDWASRHLSCTGVITGCESSRRAAEQTLTAMIETTVKEGLVVKLSGAEWQAFPQAFFKL